MDSTTTSATATAGRTSGASLAPARFMFAFDAVTAGAIGAGLLAAPDQVGQLLLGAPQDPLTARLAGAVFTGFALASVPGIKDPGRYLPLFLAQGAYKALWLATSLPAITQRPAAVGMAASFGVYLAGYAVALRAAGWPAWVRRSARG